MLGAGFALPRQSGSLFPFCPSPSQRTQVTLFLFSPLANGLLVTQLRGNKAGPRRVGLGFSGRREAGPPATYVHM